ncbi:SRPBCC domain-containing protein [Kribbella sancticallisti]|uniref:SRPBCC domain-containing protein n=1 Tax=Kribbella sancticallisti TaxID=460087 RepID=A0ABP4N5B9_9ACTN
MARIVFELEIEAPAAAVVRALDSAEGIAGWWTGDVDFAGGEGSIMRVGFPVAPKPFELRVDGVDDKLVRWTSVGDFPPHWSGTTITWTLTPTDGGTQVHFGHDGWASDDGPFPGAAMTWGQLMTSLKQYVETGRGTPLYRKD